MKRLLLIALVFWATLAHGQRFEVSLPTISSLISYPVPNIHTNVLVQGYTTANDGRGGHFYWADGDTTATNDWAIFASSVDTTGRWIRMGFDSGVIGLAAGGAVVLDWAKEELQRVSLTSNGTVSFANQPSSSTRFAVAHLLVTNTGSFTLTQPGSVVTTPGNPQATGLTIYSYIWDGTAFSAFARPPASASSSSTLTINPTDGVLPYRSSATSFGDSALNHVSSTAVGIGGTTNVLMRHVNGNDLVYTNGTTGSLVIQLRSGASATKFADFGISSSGNTMVNASTAGQAIQFTQADSTGNLTILANQFTPTANNTWDFGSSSTSGSWKNLYLAGYINWNSSTNSLRDAWGSGSPEGVLTALTGSIYRDALNGNIYKKASGSGNTGWVNLIATGSIPAEIGVAASDETTALTTGTAKVTFRAPHAITLTAVRASLTTAQTSGSIFTVDINEAGTSVLSTKITIDNSEKTSTTAATAPVISDSALADDAEITIDIDQVGDGTAKGLKIWLIGTR